MATRYRLMTTPTRYRVNGSEQDAPTDPGNAIAVAALHVELARKTGTKTGSTVIQHYDPQSGRWMDHATGGLA